MPTLLPALMTTVLHGALDRALPPPPPPPPTALTLTVGGVVFSLTPTDSTAEVSFKQNSNGSIVLSLTNFTGDLQVIAGAPAPTLPPGTHGHHPAAVTTTTSTTAAATTTPPSANVLVVEEPDSPIAADSAAQVTPAGQQKLSFQASKKMKKKKTPNTKTSDNSNENTTAMAMATAKRKKPTQAKRNDSTSSVVVASSTNNDTKNHHQSMFKKSRRGDAPPPLCQQTQTMDTQSSQPNHQQQPELSQTMPSTSTSTSSFGGSTSDVNNNVKNNANNNVAASAKTSASATSASVPTLTAVPRESVQEILARVNNSNDSVATVPGDHDEEELETGLPATPPPTTTSIRLLQDESDPMELSETPTTTNIVVSPAAAMEEGGVDDQNKLNPTTGGYPAPCPRWGHTMTGLKDGRMLIYGGQSFSLEGDPIILSDVHVYNPLQRQWDKPINCRGEARQWHSATFLPERQLLLAFGGETSMDTGTGAKRKTKVVTSDSLKVLDTEIMLWYPPAVSGDVPTGRSGHTATLVSTTNDLVLFGGVKGSKWLNTLSVLDTTRWIWTTPKVLGAAPKPRSYHSTTAVPGPNGRVKLVIFGGNNKTACFNTVHVLEYLPLSSSTSATTQAAAAATTTSWKWSHPSCQGQPPFPRTGHSATLLDDGKTIHFFGGWDPNDDEVENIFKSSFLLDTDTWMWKQGPKALAGGYGTNNSSTTESSLLLQEDCGPKRCGHTASVHPETGEVLVFGGRIPGEVLAGDFQRLVVPQPQPLPNEHHNTATTDGPPPPQEELRE